MSEIAASQNDMNWGAIRIEIIRLTGMTIINFRKNAKEAFDALNLPFGYYSTNKPTYESDLYNK